MQVSDRVHDFGRLSAKFQGTGRDALCRAAHHAFSGFDRTREGNLVDVTVGGQSSAGISTVTANHIDRARRYTCALASFCHQANSKRIELGRFDDDRVARGQRRGQ